ncbi:hypothetical protein ElyMa_005709100 [Elysia marginata]|uniref:Transposase Tc1-like domain-containing protein n=1 Tax=Elysia marginata TaxID=1093978 RepID=A0AAV4FI76_9GAST|nr:hypothetical protein ElyMa_005709100 [Elysia marginata]
MENKRKIESRHRGFERRILRRILGIRWEHRVTNKRIAERTGINLIADRVKSIRWRWLGHVLRMAKNRHPFLILTLNPQGKRIELDRGVHGGGQWTMKDQGLTKHGMS